MYVHTVMCAHTQTKNIYYILYVFPTQRVWTPEGIGGGLVAPSSGQYLLFQKQRAKVNGQQSSLT